MLPGLISALVTTVTMRLTNPAAAASKVAGGSGRSGGRLASSMLSSSTSKKLFPPSFSIHRRHRISTAAAPSAPPSPTRDGTSSSKGVPLRSSHPSMVTAHDHHQQQQRGHTAAAAAAASAVADVEIDVVEESTTKPRAPPTPPPLRVSFASLPRFETAFPNALSSRRWSLDEASRRKKELPMSSPFAKNVAGDEPAATSSKPWKPSKPTLAAAPHDSKLALFYNVYGPPPTEAAGRGESARAARDALALFHAVYGPPKHLQLLEEERAAETPSSSWSSSSSGELPSSSSSRSSSASLSPLKLQQSSSSSLSPRATTTIAPAAVPLSASSSSSSARRRLSFAKPLARGVILERPNRFTMRVRLSETGEVVSCHCPVTGALGGLGMSAFEGAGAPCLVSRVGDEEGDKGEGVGPGAGAGIARKKTYYSRKTPYTVEAVSVADPSGPPSWVGINQMAANRYIEHFWNAGALPELSSSSSSNDDDDDDDEEEEEEEQEGDDESCETSSSSPPPSSQDGRTPLVRETRIGDTRSRVDFAASGGRDLVEVKCPLDALPLLRGDTSSTSTSTSTSFSSSSSSSPKIRPNPVLAAAAAVRAQTAGERLARLPRARRAAMYERAARHASVLAGHLATAKKRERAAAARARQRARAAAKRSESEAALSDFAASLKQGALDSFEQEEGFDGEELGAVEEGKRARALLIQCFQFDAPPVRGMLPPPKGADPSSDGRAAVAAAMRSAARAGVETWQVNMRFNERGVELLDCFKLNLFPRADSSSSSSSPSSSSATRRKKKATKKSKAAKKKSENKSSSSLAAATAVAATASSSSESFSSFSSSSSPSSFGDVSDDGAALAAA